MARKGVSFVSFALNTRLQCFGWSCYHADHSSCPRVDNEEHPRHPAGEDEEGASVLCICPLQYRAHLAWLDGRTSSDCDRKSVGACAREAWTVAFAHLFLLTGMNVIRMIKLFGWEPRIIKQLNEKRDEELVSIRRNRLLGMMNNLCKCVFVYLRPGNCGCMPEAPLWPASPFLS